MTQPYIAHGMDRKSGGTGGREKEGKHRGGGKEKAVRKYGQGNGKGIYWLMSGVNSGHIVPLKSAFQ